MAVPIDGVTPGSPAARAKIAAGDTLVAINGRPIEDVLDYRFYIPDTRLKLTILSGGKQRTVRLKKAEFEEIGLEFSTYLMDEQHSCRNKCIFCFIDQLPPGMRDTLYFKDDDSRLSFLFGNYITLTNLTEHEVSRIIEMHISPINISVHTTNPELRCRMMHNRFAGDCLSILHRFVEAGLTVQCQLVLVPGYNDGEELERSLRDLAALGPAVESVAAVPVGLTKYREGLEPIRGFTPEESRRVVAQITAAGDRMLEKTGRRVFFPADEWYIKGDLPIPEGDFYEEYPQLENGVGMIALQRDQFREALADKLAEGAQPTALRYIVATGMAAQQALTALVTEAQAAFPALQAQVRAIRNDFFGPQITVAGLVTGGDLMAQLAGETADVLLLPSCMLRQEGDLFLDDVPWQQVEDTLHMQVRILPETDGGALLDAFFADEREV